MHDNRKDIFVQIVEHYVFSLVCRGTEQIHQCVDILNSHFLLSDFHISAQYQPMVCVYVCVHTFMHYAYMYERQRKSE